MLTFGSWSALVSFTAELYAEKSWSTSLTIHCSAINALWACRSARCPWKFIDWLIDEIDRKKTHMIQHKHSLHGHSTYNWPLNGNTFISCLKSYLEAFCSSSKMYILDPHYTSHNPKWHQHTKTQHNIPHADERTLGNPIDSVRSGIIQTDDYFIMITI